MTLRSGGLFAGYGGLDLAVSEVFGAEPAWFSEIDDAPSKILAHHWPTVPNHGDITKIDWDKVEPVDILSGGFPCQDVSLAGKRAGMTPDTRSGLWTHFAYAISKLRPRYVVVENVRGLLSAEAHSDVEPCTWCLGDGPGEPALRALGAVLGDVANLGYDTQWVGLPASEVGAPHGRFREFILAEDTNLPVGREWRLAAPGQAEGGRARPDAGRRDRALATDANHAGREQHCGSFATRAELAAPEHGSHVAADANRYSVREQPVTIGRSGSAPIAGHAGDASTDASGNGREWRAEPDQRAETRLAASLGDNADGRGHAAPHAASERHGDTGTPSQRRIPAATVAGLAADADDDATRYRLQAGGEGRGRSESPQRSAGLAAERGSGTAAWGQYAGAIRRWERVLGRTAPAPTELNTKGAQRLSPAFVEWMMGLPAGHVTAVPGVNRNAQLKALGNGVVPQQAIAALRHMHSNHMATLEASA